MGPLLSVERPTDGPTSDVGDGRQNRGLGMMEAIDDQGRLNGVALRNAKRAQFGECALDRGTAALAEPLSVRDTWRSA
jgi:hypothetical protein